MKKLAVRSSAWILVFALSPRGEAFAAPTEAATPPKPITQSEAAAAAPIDLEGVQLQGSTAVARGESSPVKLQGLGLLHIADGVGAGGQLRMGNWGLRASITYLPQFFIIDEDPWDEEFAHFELSSTAQLNFDALYLFGGSKGVSLGYRYSSLLGHGMGIAYQSELELAGQHFALWVPILYYPAAAERVQEQFGLQGHERVNFPFGPGLRYGAGVAWLF